MLYACLKTEESPVFGRLINAIHALARDDNGRMHPRSWAEEKEEESERGEKARAGHPINYFNFP